MIIPPGQDIPSPKPLTHAQSQKRYREKNRGKRKNERREYRSKYPDKRRAERKAYKVRKYMGRPFVGWDGEGITHNGEHRYVTLSNSHGARLESDNGERLTTVKIFEFLLSESTREQNCNHVIYGGGYDFNMWLYDMPKTALNRLYDTGRVRIGKYRVGWTRGKWFSLSDGYRKIKIFDVVSFFQTTFVKASDDYLGVGWFERDRIIEQKANRSAFTLLDLHDVDVYNDAELVNLVQLMDELRERLNRVDIRLPRWDGPGAIATELMRKHNVRDSIVQPSEDMGLAHAIRCAYFGGHFELVRFGSHDSANVYEYDINSAYPYALQFVPDLAQGRWVRTDDQTIIQSLNPHDFAVVKCEWSYTNRSRFPQPFPWRDKNGRVSYPYECEGWYWASEYCTAQDYAHAHAGALLHASEAWIFHSYSHYQPFAWVHAVYEQRRQLKASGDGAHVGLKLGINSLYGKTVQQVGARYENREWTIPPYHSLPWAGFVTALCRSMVMRSALQRPDTVIAFETDAIFTSQPLTLPIGSGLGQWEETRFTSMTYLQSGFYFAVKDDGTVVNKTRGVDRGSLSLEQCLTNMGSVNPESWFADAKLTRFVSYGLARQTSAEWCTWKVTPKRLSLTPIGKRVHSTCYYCDDTQPGITRNVWHHTVVNPPYAPYPSRPFPILWSPDYRDMPELSEREETRETMEFGYE